MRVASEVLPHPLLAHGIAAPRRVLCSSSLGRISYYEAHGASGLPVLLLHDVEPLGSVSSLRALFDELRIERPVIAPDLLGHGFSQRRGSGPFTREEHVRFVDVLLEDVSRRYGATVDVVAVGTTAEIAATAIARSSRHVRSLVLIAPPGLDPEPRIVTRLRALFAREAAALRDPNVAETYDALRVPTFYVHGDGVGGVTADPLHAFWRRLAVKPELRLIRGGKSETGDEEHERRQRGSERAEG